MQHATTAGEGSCLTFKLLLFVHCSSACKTFAEAKAQDKMCRAVLVSMGVLQSNEEQQEPAPFAHRSAQHNVFKHSDGHHQQHQHTGRTDAHNPSRHIKSSQGRRTSRSLHHAVNMMRDSAGKSDSALRLQASPACGQTKMLGVPAPPDAATAPAAVLLLSTLQEHHCMCRAA